MPDNIGVTFGANIDELTNIAFTLIPPSMSATGEIFVYRPGCP
jgi:hypothetical protein